MQLSTLNHLFLEEKKTFGHLFLFCIQRKPEYRLHIQKPTQLGMGRRSVLQLHYQTPGCVKYGGCRHWRRLQPMRYKRRRKRQQQSSVGSSLLIGCWVERAGVAIVGGMNYETYSLICLFSQCSFVRVDLVAKALQSRIGSLAGPA